MTSDIARGKVAFLAGLARLALALFGLTLLPLLYPRAATYRWLFVTYLLLAGLEQFLTARRRGGRLRSLLGGLIDLGFLTYLVHRFGSFEAVLIALYSFSSTLNTIVLGFRVGALQAVAGWLMYTALLTLERFGVLHHAIDMPRWGSLAPTSAQTVAASIFVFLVVSIPTVIAGLVMRAVRAREAELADANVQLEQLSQRDPLTQLFNRRYLLVRLETELARVRRGHPLAVVMMDLDHFKRVNDESGHMRGDMLLQQIASGLSATTRQTDVAGRYGGDEFLFILPDTAEQAACVAAGRLVACVRDVSRRFDPERPVTASVGLALAQPEDTLATLLRRADEFSYRAKERGGDRVVGTESLA